MNAAAAKGDPRWINLRTKKMVICPAVPLRGPEAKEPS
jgi:hypothetical protein